MEKYKNKKVVFMGTPDFAVPIFEALCNNTNVILCVTQPDKEVGRGKKIRYSPIKEKAIEKNIEVFQPIKIKTNYNKIIEMKPDLIVTCAYGQIIPKELLECPHYGCINVHASILPNLRGGAPIHRAIIEGYEETGITIMYMDEKMDEGDIIEISKIKIELEDNVGSLHDKLSILGSKVLIDTLEDIFKGNKRVPQNNTLATYGYNITKEDEHISFYKNSKEVHNHIRGLYPYPGGYVLLNNQVIKICKSHIGEFDSKHPSIIEHVYKDGIGIGTLDKEIIVTRLKPEGKKEMSSMDYINGHNKEELLGVKIC